MMLQISSAAIPHAGQAACSVAGRQGASSSVQHLILAHALADATDVRAKVHSSSSAAQHCPWNLAPEANQQLMLDVWSSVAHMNLW
jgi:cytochrome c oxidase assembly protein Cox11